MCLRNSASDTVSFLTLAIASLLAVVFLGEAPAYAQAYSNGPISGNIGGWTIDNGQLVSDSFVVTTDTELASAEFATWLAPADTASAVEWSIGTAPYDANVSSGTATLTDTFLHNTSIKGFNYSIHSASFALRATLTANTTYYLTLKNMVTQSGNPGYWDINDGPSTAYVSTIGPVANYPTVPPGSDSNSFQLNTATPEPGCITVVFSIGATAACIIRRRSSAPTVRASSADSKEVM